MVAFFEAGGLVWVVFSLAFSSSRRSREPKQPRHLLKPKKCNASRDQGMRINRSLRATHSRREVNRMIEEGRIRLNGRTVTNPDDRLSGGDVVKLDDHEVLWQEKDLQPHRYLKYHKPRGVVCTTDRRIGKNILDELEKTSDDNRQNRRRVYPIGRLDAESTGLILLTSDGDVVNPLLMGDKKYKEYHVVTSPKATGKNISDMRNGIVITTLARRDGMDKVPVTARTLPCLVERLDDEKNCDAPVLRFVLKEGRNRQIRKMCSALGLEVISLHRVAFAGILLDGCENPGASSSLTEKELIAIGRGSTREERRTPEEKERRKLKKLKKKMEKGRRM